MAGRVYEPYSELGEKTRLGDDILRRSTILHAWPRIGPIYRVVHSWSTAVTLVNWSSSESYHRLPPETFFRVELTGNSDKDGSLCDSISNSKRLQLKSLLS
jgi:hypothetical protein